jgi:hypothetical protein
MELKHGGNIWALEGAIESSYIIYCNVLPEYRNRVFFALLRIGLADFEGFFNSHSMFGASLK